MLTQLHVKNFALVEDLHLDLEGKLIVLTGETGAGKSILIDAIRFVLGERLDHIRFQPYAEGVSSFVEAVFDMDLKSFSQNPSYDCFFQPEDDALILRREVLPDGKSRAWINGKSVNNFTLKDLGSHLLDIHGQYDHQLLFEPASQLELIDRFGNNQNQKENYQKSFESYHQLILRKQELQKLEQGRERELDLLKYQIDELERAKLEPDEEDQLRREKIRLANAEKLYEYAGRILERLDLGEPSASSLIGESARDLSGLIRLDASLEPLAKELESTQVAFEEIVRQIRDYQEGLSFDSDRLEEIQSRLDLIDLLKKKYGKSIPDILTFLSTSKQRYDDLVNSEVYEKENEDKIRKILPEITKTAEELTARRKKAAGIMQKQIEIELKDLSIINAQFECAFQEIDFLASGRDAVEFMIRINLGQPLAPLRKIVSAGEVSRVMLALKKTLAKVDAVPTLIFDEIDANIGGRLGSITGQKLKEISEERQVLLITHLPQIASFGDKHIKVSKIVRKGKTVAEYRTIEGEERIKELAQMMSGKETTEISKKHAEEMLAKTSK